MKIKNKAAHILMPNINIVIPSSKRSQAWGMDLMVASVIFTIGIVVFYFYALNEPSEAEENINALFYDGKIIADSILSEGYPKNWTPDNVVTIGILTNNKINETKLSNFASLASSDYEKTKRLFNTRYNYWFFLNETTVPGIGHSPSNQKNLVKITRFTVYQNKPMTAYLYVWE